MAKIAYLFVGGWVAVIGFFLVNGRDFYFRGVKIDFGGANVMVGCIFIIIGVAIIVISLCIKAKGFKDMVIICPTCKELYNKKDISNTHCPKCGIELEDLNGFYDRHPELKEK